MTWTYSGNPSASDLDAVRFAIGDTDSRDPILQDEEINYLLTVKVSINNAAYEACNRIVAKFSRMADQTVGPVQTNYSQLVKHYKALANDLRVNANSNAIPYAGGICDDLKQMPPAFKKGIMDY